VISLGFGALPEVLPPGGAHVIAEPNAEAIAELILRAGWRSDSERVRAAFSLSSVVDRWIALLEEVR
jgi:hypothetical protein